jgi:hypothetical protein
MLSTVAQVDIPAVIGVMTGFCLVVVVPIVAMLLTHQRRMAELLNGKREQQEVAESQRIAALEAEVARLKQQLAVNIIAVDDHRTVAERLAPPPVPEGAPRAQS